MYIEYDENAAIEDGEYLCVYRGFVNQNCYTILTYVNSQSQLLISDYDYEGKGFYAYHSDGYYYMMDNVIAYQPIEAYFPQTKETANEW